MAFIHPHSCECLLSSLDLFSVAPTQLSIDRTKYVEYRPISTLSTGQQIEFTIPPSEEYVEISQTLIYLKVKVMKSPGVALTEVESADVLPMNYFLHSMFTQVDLSINGKLATGTNDNYAYKAFLQTLLSYGDEAKKTQLGLSLWEDTSAKRRAAIKGSRSLELIGRVHHDLCMQSRLIINNTELKFRFVPHKPNFPLYIDGPAIAADLAPIIEIEDASLYVRKISPAPSILLAHARALATSSAKYPYRKTELKTYTLISGVSGGVLDNCFHSDIPSRITIALVRHDAYNGDYRQDPFYFRHLDLTSLTLTIDGSVYDGKPLLCDFPNKNYAHAYMGLFMGLGIPFHNTGNTITYESFLSGRCLFCFDLTDDRCADDSTHVSLVKTGVVRIELRFKAALPYNVTVLVLGERESLLEVDERRNVLSTE